ncbi:Oxidoreductase AflY [Leucoagaricus sp. SymC.cos]|nr:Oxidoreductase AflY [Leucoagaricus sp. SymC.cos]
MSTPTNQNNSVDLFPVPKPLQTTILPTPQPLPGATPISTTTLREVLSDNHSRHHCYFGVGGLHNHAAHTAIALWYLGADSDVINAAYTYEKTYLRLRYTSPGPINQANWTVHLGNENYYDAYLAFFINELASEGPTATLEKYIFANSANFPGGEHKVEMLNRFNGGLVHPLIHVGYGFELGLPGMIAEGLAQAAVHAASASAVIPASWFKTSPGKDRPNSTPSVLNVLARVLADPDIVGHDLKHPFVSFEDTLERHGDKLVEYVEAWSPDLSTQEGVQAALEEVVWLSTLLYAAPSMTTEEKGLFNADFFYMHLVTSSVFLPSLFLHLNQRSKELLLHSYVSICLAWFIARGKPQLEIEAFFASDSLKFLVTDVPLPAPYHEISLPSEASPNPWVNIIQESIVHPDDHISKLQRTLLHYAQFYGRREAGYFKNTELKDAERIDGTLFVRAANLTSFRLRSTEDKNKYFGFVAWWDRRGHYQN